MRSSLKAAILATFLLAGNALASQVAQPVTVVTMPSVVIGSGTITSITNNVPTYLQAVTSGGTTYCRATNAASSTVSAVCKAGAGQIYAISVTASAATWFRVYNQTTAPTVGSGTPVFSCEASSTAACTLDVPTGFALGGGIAITATGGAADTDTTAITAAATVHINLMYR